jgi:hypothetical protein
VSGANMRWARAEVRTGRKAASHRPVFGLRIAGQEISAVYHSAVDDTEGGEAECAGRHLRSKSFDMAWHENSMSFVFMIFTHLNTNLSLDCSIDVAATDG